MTLKPALFFKEAIFYAFSLALGIFAAFNIIRLNLVGPIQTIEWNLENLASLIISLIILAAVIFLIFKIKKYSLRILFYALVVLGVDYVLGIVPAIAVLLIFTFWNRVLIHNLVLGLAIAGISAAVGVQFTPFFFSVLMIAMSVYDIVAVYVSGHMIVMAKRMIESGAIFGFVIPLAWADTWRPMSQAKGEIGERFMLLGSGDIAVPLMLVASTIRLSLNHSLFVAGFTLIGLLFTHLIFVNQKIRRPMAALPPIAVMTIIGHLLAQISNL